MGPEPWPIVSTDLYLELDEDNMLAVPIRDTRRPGSRVVTEPISEVGQAVFDRLSALPLTWLGGDAPGARGWPGSGGYPADIRPRSNRSG